MLNKLKLAKSKKTPTLMSNSAWKIRNTSECISTIPLNRGYCPPNIAPALYFTTAKHMLRDVIGDGINTPSGDHISRKDKLIITGKLQQDEKFQFQSQLAKDFVKQTFDDQQQHACDAKICSETRHFNRSISPEVLNILEKKIQTRQKKIANKNEYQFEESKILFQNNPYNKSRNYRKKIYQNNISLPKRTTTTRRKCVKSINRKQIDRNFDTPISELCPSLNKEKMEIAKAYIVRIANDPAMELDRSIRDIISKGLATPTILQYFHKIMVTMPQINDHVRMAFLERLSQYVNNEKLAQQMVDSAYDEQDLKDKPAGVLSVTRIYETRSTLDDLVKSIQRKGELSEDEIVILKEKFRTLTHMPTNKRNIVLRGLFLNTYESSENAIISPIKGSGIKSDKRKSEKLEKEQLLFPLQYIYDIVEKMPDINHTIKAALKTHCTFTNKKYNIYKVEDMYASMAASSIDGKKDNSYYDPKAIFIKDCVAVDPYELAYLKQILAKQTLKLVDGNKIVGMPSPELSTIFSGSLSYQDFQYLKKFLLTLNSYPRKKMMTLLQTLQKKANFTTANIDFFYHLARQLPLDLSSAEHQKLIEVLYDFGKELFNTDPHLRYEQVAAAIDHYKNGDNTPLIAVGTKFMNMGERLRNDYLHDPKLKQLLTPSVLRSIKLLIDNKTQRPAALRSVASLTKCFRTAIIRANREADLEIKDIVNILKRSTETPRANEAIRQLLRKFAQMNEREIYNFFNQTYTQYLTLPTILMKLIKAVEKDEVYLSRRHANLLEHILSRFWHKCPEVRHDNINELDVKTLEAIAKDLHPKRAEIYFKELKTKNPNTVSDFHKFALKLIHTDHALIKPMIRHLDDNRIKRFYQHMQTMIEFDDKATVKRKVSHDSIDSLRQYPRNTTSSVSTAYKPRKISDTDSIIRKHINQRLQPRGSLSAPSLLQRTSKTLETIFNYQMSQQNSRKNSLTEKRSDTESMKNYRLHLPSEKAHDIIKSVHDIIKTRQKHRKHFENALEVSEKHHVKAKSDDNKKNETEDKGDKKKISKAKDAEGTDKINLHLKKGKRNNAEKDEEDSVSTTTLSKKKNEEKENILPEGNELISKDKPLSPSNKVLSNELLTDNEPKKKKLTKASKTKDLATASEKTSPKENVNNLYQNQNHMAKSSEENILGEKNKIDPNNQGGKKSKGRRSQDLEKGFDEGETNGKQQPVKKSAEDREKRLSSEKRQKDQMSNQKEQSSNQKDASSNQKEKQQPNKLSQTKSSSSVGNASNETSHSKRAHAPSQQNIRRTNEDTERLKSYKTLKALRYGSLYNKKPFSTTDRQFYWTQDDLLALFNTGIHSIQRRPTYLTPKIPIKSPTDSYQPKHCLPTLFNPLDYTDALKNPNNEIKITPSFTANMWRAGELNEFNVKKIIDEVVASETLSERQKEMLLKSLNDYAADPMIFANVMPKLRLAYHAPVKAHEGFKLLHPQSHRHPVNDPVYLAGAAKYCPALRRTVITFWDDKKPSHTSDNINDNDIFSSKKLKARRRRSI